MHPQDESSVARFVRRARLHWQLGRNQGFRRLVEEDELNLFTRSSEAARNWRWRRLHPRARGSAVPVYVVGVQRSGTNMLTRGFRNCPEFHIYNENNRSAFHRFQLRPDPIIRSLIESSRHAFVLFKPLCDSHRVDHLLELVPAQPGKAIWIYRAVDGRVRSALAHFGQHNLDVLREIATGNLRSWQAQGLSEESLALISGFDYDRMSPASAAALFWYVRNAMYFELGLCERDDVSLVSYDAMIRDPEGCMRALCSFLSIPYDPKLTAHMRPNTGGDRERLEVDPAIRERCDALQDRLDSVYRDRLRNHRTV